MMRKRIWLFGVLLLAAATTCGAAEVVLERARDNGKMAHEALLRSKRVLDAYLKRLDPVTGLLPRRAGQNAWYVQDSAADLYPFLVMAAYFTDRSAYDGPMHAILRHEIRHSTRFGMLSDNVLPGGGFEHQQPDLQRAILVTCEYAKDGLLPLTELLGHHAWYHRLRGITDDIINHAPYETRFGKIPVLTAEENGELLQVLARLAFLTREPRYADQALRIADFYFQQVIPKSNGLPAHLWDLEAGKPAGDAFRFTDHGNEIVGGLAELVLFLKETRHPRYEQLRAPLARLVHTLLDCGRNEDGVWYSSISIASRQPIDRRHAHCWGYLFNGVYTTYLITGEQRFLDATRRALRAVTEKPAYLDDPQGSGRKYGSNAYSDALESAIALVNRLPDEQTFSVIDECTTRFLHRQRPDGIIEDWYGDGNYVRTALMYALMKSQGCWLEPWRDDVRLGAAPTPPGVVWTLEADQPWSGRLHFDFPRHRLHFGLTVNYPRLNEFPEWHVVEPTRLYDVEIGDERLVRLGAELIAGLPIEVQPQSTTVVKVRPLPGPPYGTR